MSFGFEVTNSEAGENSDGGSFHFDAGDDDTTEAGGGASSFDFGSIESGSTAAVSDFGADTESEFNFGTGSDDETAAFKSSDSDPFAGIEGSTSNDDGDSLDDPFSFGSLSDDDDDDDALEDTDTLSSVGSFGLSDNLSSVPSSSQVSSSQVSSRKSSRVSSRVSSRGSSARPRVQKVTTTATGGERSSRPPGKTSKASRSERSVRSSRSRRSHGSRRSRGSRGSRRSRRASRTYDSYSPYPYSAYSYDGYSYTPDYYSYDDVYPYYYSDEYSSPISRQERLRPDQAVAVRELDARIEKAQLRRELARERMRASQLETAVASPPGRGESLGVRRAGPVVPQVQEEEIARLRAENARLAQVALGGNASLASSLPSLLGETAVHDSLSASVLPVEHTAHFVPSFTASTYLNGAAPSSRRRPGSLGPGTTVRDTALGSDPFFGAPVYNSPFPKRKPSRARTKLPSPNSTTPYGSGRSSSYTRGPPPVFQLSATSSQPRSPSRTRLGSATTPSHQPRQPRQPHQPRQPSRSYVEEFREFYQPRRVRNPFS